MERISQFSNRGSGYGLRPAHQTPQTNESYQAPVEWKKTPAQEAARRQAEAKGVKIFWESDVKEGDTVVAKCIINGLKRTIKGVLHINYYLDGSPLNMFINGERVRFRSLHKISVKRGVDSPGIVGSFVEKIFV